ncbi:MAG: transglycosylase SLT domain-containing protein [Solirubrobacterales bacterium]
MTRYGPVQRLLIVAAGALAAVLVAAGGTEDPEPEPPAPSPSLIPKPNERLPHQAGALADRLTEVADAARTSIDEWRADGISRGRPPKAVVHQALYHQRVHRLLAKDRRLARHTIARLPGRHAKPARQLTAAIRNLGRLAGPPGRRKFRTGSARPAGVLERYYRQAQRRFDVGWRVLAAVNLVETVFNRLRNNSSAGARGPMQFIPATWRQYGMGGNVHDPRDAIMGAANYLHASGAPGNYRRALFAYNNSGLYVGAVLRYARQMKDQGYLLLYNWQVFVRTPSGERRLTGPGR